MSDTQSIDLVESLNQARRVVRRMAQGIMPAEKFAGQALQALSQTGAETQEVDQAQRVLSSIRMRLAPSQENCLAADREIQTLISKMVQGQGDAMRSMRMR